MIEPIYTKQGPLLNENEVILYENLKIAVGTDYLLIPQVHLEKLIKPRRNSFFGKMKYAVGHISRKSVDFALFDTRSLEPLLAIELNGTSHTRRTTIRRDVDVKHHLEQAGLPLLTFQNGGSETPFDIRSRIEEQLNNEKFTR